MLFVPAQMLLLLLLVALVFCTIDIDAKPLTLSASTSTSTSSSSSNRTVATATAATAAAVAINQEQLPSQFPSARPSTRFKPSSLSLPSSSPTKHPRPCVDKPFCGKILRVKKNRGTRCKKKRRVNSIEGGKITQTIRELCPTLCTKYLCTCNDKGKPFTIRGRRTRNKTFTCKTLNTNKCKKRDKFGFKVWRSCPNKCNKTSHCIDNKLEQQPDVDVERAPRTIVLNSGDSIIASELQSPLNFVSPSGLYQLSVNQQGELTLRRNLNTIDTDSTVIANWSDVVWRKDGVSDNDVDTTSIDGVEDNNKNVTRRRNIKFTMQTDGNCVLRDTVAGITIWKSVTQANPGAYFVLDDDGQIQIIDPITGYPLYLDGIPKSRSNNNSNSGNLGPYPVRGSFYYPWFPTTWTSDDNSLAHYIPKLGQYDSGHYHTIINHVQQLDYGNIKLGISSWWGPDTKSDKARFLLMLDASYQFTDGRLKWCIYFEPQDGDDTVEGIRSKLNYLKEWFVDHPSYARTSDDNKPVIFVYNRNKKDFDHDCHTIAKFWNKANLEKEWHIVLKLFSGWRDCDYQPDSWHQYGPSTQFHYQGATNYAPGFVNISPGFWHAKESEPRLKRLTSIEWTNSVQKMSALRDDDNIKWHLITSFNEAVEGTIIEATEDWDTKSGMGYFLDALHHN